jgi:AraC family transcriptional regulator
LLISSELQWQQAHSDLNLEALKRLLAVTLLRQYSISSKKILNKSDELPPNKLQRAIAYINDHLGEGLSLHKIAAVVEISPYYFARLFKEATGVALHRYLTNRRMEKAKQLLSEQNLSIVQVAKQVGIGSQSHFNRLFRNYTGTTPNAYRNERK